MAKEQQVLYAVELDIGDEAGVEHYWVIHEEEVGDVGERKLCVYESAREAALAAKGRDHASRVVKFIREVK